MSKPVIIFLIGAAFVATAWLYFDFWTDLLNGPGLSPGG